MPASRGGPVACSQMCGRFLSSTPVSVLAEQFLAAEVTAEEREPRYNVAPTDPVLAVATSRGVRRLGTLSWGLVPSWADAAAGGRRMVNLRSETVAERPGFRRMLKAQRCIVPADGFYEWRAAGAGRPRQPYLIRARDRSPLALAGLWDVWADRTDSAAERLRTCTVLTTTPNNAVATLHDRMPVILPPETWDTWLDPARTDVAMLTGLLRPCEDDLLELVAVGTAVNDVRNDGPSLIEPVDPAQLGEQADRSEGFVQMLPFGANDPPMR